MKARQFAGSFAVAAGVTAAAFLALAVGAWMLPTAEPSSFERVVVPLPLLGIVGHQPRAGAATLKPSVVPQVASSGGLPGGIDWPPGFATALTFPVLPGFVRYRIGPAGGTVWQGPIPNLVVPSDRRTSEIYLPPSFSAGSSYPVLYLLHGTPGSPSSYVNGLDVARIFDAEIVRGRIRPFIAVVPPAGLNSLWMGEWTGPWESYIVTDVVPWVDVHLPTVPLPADRAIAGLSAGGYGAIDIGLRHPGMFGTLESWSGYFTAPRDGSLAHMSTAHLRAYDPSRLVRIEVAALHTTGTRFFVSSATTHDPITAGWARRFSRELSDLNLPHQLLLLPGGHDGAFWLAQLPAALAYAEPAGSRADPASRTAH